MGKRLIVKIPWDFSLRERHAPANCKLDRAAPLQHTLLCGRFSIAHSWLLAPNLDRVRSALVAWPAQVALSATASRLRLLSSAWASTSVGSGPDPKHPPASEHRRRMAWGFRQDRS